MAGYLDQYGAGDERRMKIIKTLVISLVTLAVLGGSPSSFFTITSRSARPSASSSGSRRRITRARTSYGWRARTTAAGILSHPSCRTGVRRAGTPDVAGYKISKSRSCGNGVILTVDFAKGQQEKLWVQREDLVIGFSPLPGCPAPR